MAELIETYACSPTTERGRGILISGDAKSDTILYTNARSVVIRSLSNPLQASVYGEHSHPVTVARFSPNGEWVASADVSGVVRVWGTRGDRALKNEFRPLSGRIDDLQWSPDGQRIVVSGDGRGKSFVRAFMWDTGTTIGEFDGHSRRVLSCAFKPTRPFRIVTCGEDFLVNFYEGPPFKFKHSSREHSNFVNCVRFSPDGSKFITVSSDKKGLIYDGKSGEKIGELSNENGHTGTIYALSWSPDGKNVLTVSADKTAKIWEISEDGSGKVSKTLTPPGIGGFEDMLIGCLWQNSKLLTISLGGLFNLYPEPDKDPITFSGHMKSVSSLCCVSGEESGIEIPVLSASYDGVIVRWILGSGFQGRVLRKENSQIKCFLASDGEIITSAYDNKVWRIPLNGNSCGDSEFIDIGSQAQSLSLSPSQNLLLIGSDSSLSLLQNFKPLSSSKLGFQITALAISPDGIEAVVGGQDGKLRVYSIKDGVMEEEGVIEKHRGSITVIKYSPDGSMFATADTNREAVVWDRATREVKLKNMLYHTARINCVAWSGNSKFIATGSLDTCVIIYELERNACQRVTIKGAHLGGVYGLSFVGDDRIVSAGEDACLRVWKLATE